VKLFT